MKAGVTTRYNLKRTTATKLLLFGLDFEFGTRTINITEQQTVCYGLIGCHKQQFSIIKGPW